MLRILSRVVVIAAMVGAASLTPASFAAATATVAPEALQDCPARALCGWFGAYYTGPMTTFSPGAGCLNSPFALQSAANTYPSGGFLLVTMAVYSQPNCTGTRLAVLGPARSASYLATAGYSVETVI